MRVFPIPLLILSFFVLQLIGCNCKKKSKTCPALSSTYKSYISADIGDTIRFVNKTGIQTGFLVREKNVWEIAEYRCDNNPYNNCVCPDCKAEGGYGAFSNDTLWTWFDTLNNKAYHYGRLYYTIYESVESGLDRSTLQFNGLEFRFEYPITSENLDGNQRIIADTVLGSHSYQNLIVCTIDTSSSWDRYHESFYTKLFFKPEIGVVGFHHVKLNDTFYLP